MFFYYNPKNNLVKFIAADKIESTLPFIESDQIEVQQRGLKVIDGVIVTETFNTSL